jgi:hypothetical protein
MNPKDRDLGQLPRELIFDGSIKDDTQDASKATPLAAIRGLSIYPRLQATRLANIPWLYLSLNQFHLVRGRTCERIRSIADAALVAPKPAAGEPCGEGFNG